VGPFDLVSLETFLRLAELVGAAGGSIFAVVWKVRGYLHSFEKSIEKRMDQNLARIKDDITSAKVETDECLHRLHAENTERAIGTNQQIAALAGKVALLDSKVDDLRNGWRRGQ
jgi:hypothetical protein